MWNFKTTLGKVVDNIRNNPALPRIWTGWDSMVFFICNCYDHINYIYLAIYLPIGTYIVPMSAVAESLFCEFCVFITNLLEFSEMLGSRFWGLPEGILEGQIFVPLAIAICQFILNLRSFGYSQLHL